MAGGAWKVAYADFVTALFALFMVLWILGQDEEVKGTVSAHFRDPWQAITRKSTTLIQMREDDVVSARESHFKGDAPIEREHQRINEEEVIKTFMNNKELRENRNIEMERVDEGVLINFFSKSDENLFKKSTEGDLALSDYGRMALGSVGTLLARYNLNDGKGSPIEITGHTPEGIDDPWTTSALQSAEVFNEILKTGVQESQVVKIVGAGDTILLDEEKPFDNKNQRFEILIRTKPEE
ncbi:MAG: flagellar motor protein MotB [Verrucomicrobiota bacterium]|jgi:chemotaxis protein MotB|nr:flagellar motor protein MotB [Verrucomicrobiota bacterium]